MVIEGLVLTGGAGRRMGSEKALLTVQGESVAQRTARQLAGECGRVTILGRTPLSPYDFLEDQEEFAGPLSALARFDPIADTVFVASCDMPRFDGRLVPFLLSLIEGADAVVPVLGDRMQPLCALYSARLWEGLPARVSGGEQRMLGWLDTMTCRQVTAHDFTGAGIDPLSVKGANTPEEWRRLAPQ